MQRKIPFSLDAYRRERQQLAQAQIDALFEKGEAWNLSSSFQGGGSAIFPHTFISPCGPQIAAVVRGCFESGAERVIALGVFHALEERPSPGVMGPGLRGSEAWKREFSLETFCFLWDQWLLRKGEKGPQLLLRYPFGILGAPEELPGMKELRQEAKGALVVATSDLCHHGVPYGDAVETWMLCHDPRARRFAIDVIKEGFRILATGDLELFSIHCHDKRSDGKDVCLTLQHLLGPLKEEIRDLHLVDVSSIYAGQPVPSWVAATLVALSSKKS